MNDSKDFQDAESIRSGNPHVSSRPVSFPLHPIPEGMLRHSFITPAEKGRQVFGTHMVHRQTFFANADASSSAPYPQELHQWISSIEEPLHSSMVEKSERQEQNQDLRCQSGPSAKDSVILSGGDSSKNYGADQQRLQILDLHFDQVPYVSNLCLLEDKIQDRGMYLFAIPPRKPCNGSKKWRWLIQWMI